MSNRDFFDDDLLKKQESDLATGLATKTLSETDNTQPQTLGSKPVSELDIGKMARQKEQVEGKMAHAMEELELLRQRQKDLEREKTELVDLQKRQQNYTLGRQQLMDQLSESLVSLEKQEIRVEQLAEVISSTRRRFRGMLAELEEMNADQWPEEKFREELNRSLASIDDSRIEYEKAVAKVEGLTGAKAKMKKDKAATDLAGIGAPNAQMPSSYGQWIAAGFCFSLPLIITGLVLAVYWLSRQPIP